MSSFRTDVGIHPYPFPITLESKILTTGSCFADTIGERLNRNKFQALVNPFGVIYNPHSIHRVLRYAVFNEGIPEHTYLKNGEVYLNYNFHSTFSALHSPELLYKLTNAIGAVHYFLKDTSWLMITYGTAWVYERVDTGEIVANCHKMPSTLFRKSLLTEQKVAASFEHLYGDLKVFNPNLRIILTVSPVRHIKDTLELNSVSKSVLRVACHNLAEKFPDVEYFPAYEMMIDDLRDYRFYKSDMIHPSEDAEEYIWQKFAARFFDDPTKNFLKKWNDILTAMAHKPFHPESVAHQQFLGNILKSLEDMPATISVENEIQEIKSKLAGT